MKRKSQKGETCDADTQYSVQDFVDLEYNFQEVRDKVQRHYRSQTMEFVLEYLRVRRAYAYPGWGRVKEKAVQSATNTRMFELSLGINDDVVIDVLGSNC